MKDEILNKVDILYRMWKEGSLGGEVMPEDENPRLERDSTENYLYFTLPMALNYQRNSYSLWESANKTYQDEQTRFVFNPKEVMNCTFEEVQMALTKYKVALQKNKQTEIWIRLCKTFVELFDGDVKKLFDKFDNDVEKIKNYMQKENKHLFPYLCGNKICNYWLYVIWQYTGRTYKNVEKITVAADTHVIKATHRLGLITDDELEKANVQEIVIDRWNNLFDGTKYRPIDIHTALWLWSRNGFKTLEKKNKLEMVLESCSYVQKNSKHVNINSNKIKELVRSTDFSVSSHWLASNPFGIFDLDVKDIVNFLVIFDSIDFSFWGNPKWSIEKDKEKIDGAFALMYSLLELMKVKKGLDFERISFDEFANALKGNIEIPLLKERYEIVLQISKIINLKMKGNFYNYIKNVTDGLQLLNIIVNNFPSFEDKRNYNGVEVYFYKLAQLVTSDILHIRSLKEGIDVNCSALVGCADYKIPQVLRGLGVLEYDDELANIVDNKIEILENSIYEVEIRVGMIIAVDLIKKKLKNKVDSIVINDIIWTLGQDKSRKFMPYHLTRTTKY